MIGMNAKMKITTTIKIRVIHILKVRGAVINSWGAVEEITRLDRERQGNLINSLMGMSQMQIGQPRILRQRKSHLSTKMILISIGLFKPLWRSNQIWTLWWTRKITMTKLLPPHQHVQIKLLPLRKMEVFCNTLRVKISLHLSLPQLSALRLLILSKSVLWWCKTRENSLKRSLPLKSSEPRKSLSKPKKIQLWRIWGKRNFISKTENNCTN